MSVISRKAFLTGAGSTALALALGLAGCGQAGASSGPGSQGGSKRRVAMFIDGTISDGGWGASAYQAMADAAKKLGWETAYSENVVQSDWVTAIQTYADQGYDAVFAPGSQYADAVKQVAADYPDTKFLVLNGSIEADNVESLRPDNEQIGQIAGALAGILTKTGSVGFIGGTELDTTKVKADMFGKAAKALNPAVKVTVAYAGSYNDAAKGKEIASSMVTGEQVDVMYGDASVVDTGAREALKAHAGCMDIGQPSDLGGADDALIACSVVTDSESMVEQALRSAEKGDFGNKTITGGLKNGGVKVGTFSQKLVTAEQQQRFAEALKKIEAGTLL